MTDDSSAVKAALKGTGKHRIIRHSIGQWNYSHAVGRVRIFTSKTRDHRQLSPHLDKTSSEILE